MIFVGIVIGIIIIGAMAYLALNKKSSFHIRLASLAALAVMILTVIICLIVFFSDREAPIDWSTYRVGEPVTVDEDDNSAFTLIFSIIFFLALFIIIAVLAMKEHKKSKPKFNDALL